VSHSPTLVTGLGSGIGTILHNVTNLVAVVTGVLLLAAVPGDVPSPVALVAPVLLLATFAGKVAKPVTLVALAAASTATSEALTVPEAASESASLRHLTLR